MGRSKGEKAFEVFNIVFMGFVAMLTLYPLVYVLMASVSEAGLLIRHSGLLLRPLGFQIEAYKIVMNNPDTGRSYLNTLMYMSIGVVISMFMTIIGAYGLSRKAMWMRVLTFFIVFSMWFRAGMIPFYLVVGENLNLKNTLWALVLPRAVATYNLIVLRTGFAAVPVSLEESARIDGAKDFSILWNVFVPLCTANIAVIALFYMVGAWNSWFDAMLFINNRRMFPLQIILREILVINSTNNMMTASGVAQGDQVGVAETVKYATIVIATLPILCVYPFIQKYFVKGVMIGAIKG